MDLFAERQSIKAVDLLKIDVEGFELKVIEGTKGLLSAHNVGFVYVESEPIESRHHFVPIQTLNEAMLVFGYKFFGVYEQQPHWTGQKNLLFFNPMYISPKLVAPDIKAHNYPL